MRLFISVKRYIGRALTRKMVLLFGSVLFCAIILAGVLLNKQAEDYFKTRLIEILHSEVHAVNIAANQRLNDYQRTLSQIKYNLPIRNLLEAGYYKDAEMVNLIRQNIIQYLSGLKISGSHIENLHIFSLNSQIFSAFGALYNADRVKDALWFLRALDAQLGTDFLWDIHLTDAAFSPTGNREPIISAYTHIFSRFSQAAIGLAELQVTRADFLVDVLKLSDGFSSEHDAYFFSGNELFASSPAAPELTNAVPLAQSAKDGCMIGTSSYVRSFDIPRLNLTALYVFTLNPPAGMMGRNLRLMLPVLLTAGIALMLITLYFLTKITSRLNALTKAVQSLEISEWHNRLNEDNNEDEVGILARCINHASIRISNLFEEKLRLEVATREAELKALQAQINPHYIYNALEIIHMTAETRDEIAIADALSALGSTMRYNISHSIHTRIPLGEELHYLRNYFRVQNMLLSGRMFFDVSLSPELLLRLDEVEIIKFAIQPLIENSIKYAFENGQNEGVIMLKLWLDGDMLHALVEDNGVGIAPNTLEQIHARLNCGLPAPESEGIGLYNVNLRLKLTYKGASGLSITSVVGKGTQMYFAIPIRLKKGGALE